MDPSADADYAIFQLREKGSTNPPTVYLKDPSEPLPSQLSHRNPCFYLFHSDHNVPVQPPAPVNVGDGCFMRFLALFQDI